MKKKILYPGFRFGILMMLGLWASNGVTAQIITTIAGSGTAGYGGDGGAATTAELYHPAGVATDGSGNVYIADGYNNRIRKVTPSGTISTIAGIGTGGYSGDGGAAIAAELLAPTGVAVDGSGNVYIADQTNNRIRKVSPSGTINTFAGDGSSGYSGDGGPATAAKLYNPRGVAVDGSGNVYIADNNNQRIRKVTSSGIITTIAGNGTAGYSGDGGPATGAELNTPAAIAVDGSGNLYIAEQSNNCIRKLTPSGTISTLAGNGSAGYSGDGGAATTAELNQPWGVAVDGSGNVYIADSYNHRIRKVMLSGIISTIAGNGTGSYTGDGGPATAAELYYPLGVAIDGMGNVYIGDELNNRTRKVNCTLPSVTAITGSVLLCPGATLTLTDTTSGGAWSCSSSSIASVNATTGVVTGVTAGSGTITYIVTNSCGSDTATQTITVNPLPHAAAISGTDSLCPGYTTTFTDTTSGGTWMSTNPSIASVNSSGVVNSLMPGAVNILYFVTNSCGSDTAVFPFVVKGMVDCPDAVIGLDHEGGSKLTIYPNPNEGYFTIAGNVTGAGTGELTFEVRDVVGRVVKVGTGLVINGKFEVPVQLDRALHEGYYYVRIFAGGVVLAKNFVVGR